MIPPKNLRQGLTEKAFRRWELVIKNILGAWPEITHIDPDQFDLAIETITARLRDAIRSLHDYEWPTKWDSSVIKAAYPALQVAQRGGHVIVGPSDKIRALGDTLPEPDQPLVETYVTLDDPTKEVLEGYCFLASFRLEGLPRARVTNFHLDTSVLEELEANYDISIIRRSADFLII